MIITSDWWKLCLLGVPPQAADAAAVLDQIFDVLGGIRAEQAAKRTTPLPGDFIHLVTYTVIEVDEMQHFTSFRRLSLSLYPADQPLNFDAKEYSALCRSLSLSGVPGGCLSPE